MQVIEKTDRTTIKRLPSRGYYERETVNRILDEGLICHVGFIVDGRPRVIPTGYVRVGQNLYIHGSPASVMLRSAVKDIDICVTVTLLDGLVLARSAFHHSMNYRSVVVYGKARLVDDPDEKLMAMERFVEHVVPGRWKDVRGPNPTEFKGTTVLAIPIDEASAKIRVGPPIDDKEDHSLDVWAGVLPMKLAPGTAVDDPELREGISVPVYVTGYTRPVDKLDE